MTLPHPFKVLGRGAAVLAVASLYVAASGAGLSAVGSRAAKAQDAPSAPPPAAPPPAQPHETTGPETPLQSRKSQRVTRQNRAAFLSSLYDQLKAAPNEEAAGLIAKAIERVWRQSGSDTADLIMERAGIAIQAKNFDLAIQLLSGLV